MRLFDRGMRALSVVVMVIGLCGALGPVLAQEATISASAPSMMDTVMAVLKAVLPTALSFVGPLITKGISSLVEGLSPVVGGMLSTVLGSLLGAVAAGFEGLPQDAYAVVGAGAGGLGHAVLQSKPIQDEPVKSGG